jgi:hypothetical protein
VTQDPLAPAVGPEPAGGGASEVAEGIAAAVRAAIGDHVKIETKVFPSGAIGMDLHNGDGYVGMNSTADGGFEVYTWKPDSGELDQHVITSDGDKVIEAAICLLSGLAYAPERSDGAVR